MTSSLPLSTEHASFPQLAGVLYTDIAQKAFSAPQGLASIEFTSGFFAYHQAQTLFQENGCLCIALGQPRFCEPEATAIADRIGPGAAWLDAFRRLGLDAPQKVQGRFAVVIIDPSANKLWMANDRLGTIPLCYAIENTTIAFSDRIDTVPASDRHLAQQALFDYLYHHVIPGPDSIFEHIQRLPAGHVLAWEKQSATLQAYWKPRFTEPRTGNFEALKTEFLDIVRNAVAREADGYQVGAFLSGGTDSSTVSGMLCKILGAPAKTYSMGFDASGYDEMEYARIAAKHFGTEHHEYYVTPDDLVEGIPLVARHFDQPFGNSSAVPAWICARRAREDGIEKLLAGDGGDELFGGNSRYAKQRIFGWYDFIPRPLRQSLLEPLLSLSVAKKLPVIKKAASYVEQASVPLPDRTQMYNLLLRLGPSNVFTPDFLASIDTHHTLRYQQTVWQSTSAQSSINRMLAYDWKYTLTDNDLPKVVGSTQLAGVEVGFPLLADELIEFSMKLPPEWKLKGLTLRWFFKEALKGFLPEAIITKKKHGFGLPFGVWAVKHDKLARLASDSLDAFAARGVVRRDFLHELITQHLPEHPGYYGEMVWVLMMLEQWLQAHSPNWRFES